MLTKLHLYLSNKLHNIYSNGQLYNHIISREKRILFQISFSTIHKCTCFRYVSLPVVLGNFVKKIVLRFCRNYRGTILALGAI